MGSNLWKDMPCAICLSPYRGCRHWPNFPEPKPSDEALAEIYKRWKHPPTAEKPKPALRVSRPVIERAPRPEKSDPGREPLYLPLGIREWYEALGRRGGASRSERKQEAARLNGKQGGRPRSSHM